MQKHSCHLGEGILENNEVSVRKQGGIDLGTKKITTFAADLLEEVDKMMNVI